MKRPVGWVERRPTKKLHIAERFQATEKPEITRNRVKPNALGYRHSLGCWVSLHLLPERFIEKPNTIYSESETVALPLNPTYVLTFEEGESKLGVSKKGVYYD